MTQEDKDLLIRDLSSRLPYDVKISIPDLWTHKEEIETLDEIFKGDDGIYRVNSSGVWLEYVKPYLFPLSSLTREQEIKCCAIKDMGPLYYHRLIDRYNEWHIDYRGFISKGLALDATGLNIY